MYFLFTKYLIQKSKDEYVFFSKNNDFTRKWEEVRAYSFFDALLFTMFGFGIMKDIEMQVLE